MEIKKENLHLNKQMIQTDANFMVEGDVVATDLYPDIREILFCDAKAVCDTKTYQNGTLNVCGTVELNILYLPDEKMDADALKSLSASLPFSNSFDIPGGENMAFTASCETEHIGFHLVNSTKLSVKVIVSMGISGFLTETITPILEIEDNMIECRKKKIKIDSPCIPMSKTITVSDLLTVPADFPDIDEIAKTECWAYAEDTKPMNDKVMVKGMLCVKTLYNAYDGENIAVCVSHKIPFTEIFDAPGVTEDHNVCFTFYPKNVIADAKGDLNGDTKIISFSADLTATIYASKPREISIVDDCYAVSGGLNSEKQNFAFSEFIAEDETEFTENIRIQSPKDSAWKDMIFTSCKPMVKETFVENGVLYTKGTLICFVLYREDGENGALKSLITETEFERKKPVSRDGISAENTISVLDVVCTKTSPSEATLTLTAAMHTKLFAPAKCNIITECTKMKDDNEKRPCPALTIYFVQSGDTLWNIAKKYGTTVEKIKNANGLTDSFLSIGTKLLIPKAC